MNHVDANATSHTDHRSVCTSPPSGRAPFLLCTKSAHQPWSVSLGAPSFVLRPVLLLFSNTGAVLMHAESIVAAVSMRGIVKTFVRLLRFG